ncbi:unnamed protein product [Ixodes pacificus]
MEAMSSGEAFDKSMDVLGKTVYLCRLCTRPFQLLHNLKRHMKVHDPNQESFLCTLCSRKYSRKDDLKRHLKQAHGITSMPIDACDERGRMLRHLALHAPKYQCDICFKLFSRKHYALLHRKIKHGIDFGPY